MAQTLKDRALALHKKLCGKIAIACKIKIKSLSDLDLLYTPGVAEVSKVIAANKELVYDYTCKKNNVAIVTDGTRVLGLGDIGPEAALPVMEGKALIAQAFAGVDMFPICLNTKNVDEIVETVKRITPVFGAIHLEDIQSPKVFEIEKRLTEELEIPVFHDDQHGTAIAVLAALLNALKVVKKELKDTKIVIAGAGAGGIGIARLIHAYNGDGNLILTDSQGTIYKGRGVGMNKYKEEVAEYTNKDRLTADLKSALVGADIFIGVSGTPNLLAKEDLKKMTKGAIVFALSNPTPEILPSEAMKVSNVAIAATGRSDFPNQVNNSIVFPSLLRGVLDARAKKITNEMKIVAAEALASYIPAKKLRPDYIIPRMTDKGVFEKVSKAVFAEAKNEQV